MKKTVGRFGELVSAIEPLAQRNISFHVRPDGATGFTVEWEEPRNVVVESAGVTAGGCAHWETVPYCNGSMRCINCGFER